MRSVTGATSTLFARRFKLFLASGFSADEQRQIKPPTGLPPELTPQRLVADFLRFLKDAALSRISEAHGKQRLDATSCVWLLPVPAGWSNAAIQTMREAAVSAGIIPTVKDTRQVFIASPPAELLLLLSLWLFAARAGLRVGPDCVQADVPI